MITEKTYNAYAKINLGLDVTGLREDGYHLVRMIMQNVRLYDKVTVRRTEKEGITMTSNLSFLPNDDSNLMVKAAKMMFDLYDLPGGLVMELDKHIPVAAGMAGGSTDAAAVLHGVNQLFELNLGTEKLMEIGLKLGADVPFCVMRATALAEGIGEKLTALPPCPKCYVVVAKPPVSISTKIIYAELDEKPIENHPDIDALVEALKNHDLSQVCANLGNVLEPVTVKHCPTIEEIKKCLDENGAMGSLMSGSGPSVFGLFADHETATKAAEAVKKEGRSRFVRVVEMMP